MTRFVLLITALSVTPAAADITAPSGLMPELGETIFEPVGVVTTAAKIMRLQFVSADLADQTRYDFATIEADFEWLCQTVGLPRIEKSAPNVEQIIVSLASELVPLGETTPEVVQYFDAFQVSDGKCIWEGI